MEIYAKFQKSLKFKNRKIIQSKVFIAENLHQKIAINEAK